MDKTSWTSLVTLRPVTCCGCLPYKPYCKLWTLGVQLKLDLFMLKGSVLSSTGRVGNYEDLCLLFFFIYLFSSPFVQDTNTSRGLSLAVNMSIEWYQLCDFVTRKFIWFFLLLFFCIIISPTKALSFSRCISKIVVVDFIRGFYFALCYIKSPAGVCILGTNSDCVVQQEAFFQRFIFKP